MFSKIRRAARRLPHALAAVRNCWEQETYEWTRGFERGGDVYEVHSPLAAEWLGEKWPGRPFVLYPNWHYDRFDHVFTTLDAFWYVMSGEAEADQCRDADERMLANAY